MKKHYFSLEVTTNGNRKAAETAVLCAFAKRSPDSCEFRLGAKDADKAIWMAGAESGIELAFDAITKSVEELRTKLTRKRSSK